MKKVMFGVCTFNRKQILEYSAYSLGQIENIELVDVRIFDDCSTEFELDFLRKLYPFATSIYGSEKNMGADHNSLRMLQNFLESDNEWLFIADSDLIYSENLISVIENFINKYENGKYFGVLSLFNTCTHPVKQNIDVDMCRKEEVGAAGVLMCRDVANLIIKNRDDSKHYDVNFSKVLRDNGYDILCSNKSYVQHVGIEGYNSLFYAFDWGQSFESSNPNNMRIIFEVIDQLMLRIASEGKSSVEGRMREEVDTGRIGVKVLVHMLILAFKRKLFTQI